MVVAGGGEPVAWKAELLAAAGARVRARARPEPGAAGARRRRAGDHPRRAPWRPATSTAPAWRSPRRRARRPRASPPRRAAAAPSSTSSTSRPSATSSSAPSSTARRWWSDLDRRRRADPRPGDPPAHRGGPARSLAGWGATAKGFRERLPCSCREGGAARRFWERFVDVAFISQARGGRRNSRELERLARELPDGAGRPPDRRGGDRRRRARRPGAPDPARRCANCRPPT